MAETKYDETSVVTITIERKRIVWKQTKNWNRLHDDPTRETQYGYIEAVLPQIETMKLYEQTVGEEQLNLSAVIGTVNGL